jgi:hypothetical protein
LQYTSPKIQVLFANVGSNYKYVRALFDLVQIGNSRDQRGIKITINYSTT